MLKRILLLTAILFACQSVKSQSIKYKEHHREGNKIVISYSIDEARFYHVFDVEVYISVNGGEEFVGPLLSVEGDVGEGISSGKSKTIYWDVFKEFDQLEGDLVIDIRAKVRKNIVKKYFLVYQGNHITPYGLKIGHIGLFGWYVSAFTNTNFNIYDYEMKNGLVSNYPIDQYYEIQDDKKILRYSVIVGANYQIFKNVYLNAGLGYGYKEQMYLAKEYSYVDDGFIKDAYLKEATSTYSGLEIETGIMYRYNNFLIYAGCNSLNFKRLDWSVGLGYCF